MARASQPKRAIRASQPKRAIPGRLRTRWTIRLSSSNSKCGICVELGPRVPATHAVSEPRSVHHTSALHGDAQVVEARILRSILSQEQVACERATSRPSAFERVRDTLADEAFPRRALSFRAVNRPEDAARCRGCGSSLVRTQPRHGARSSGCRETRSATQPVTQSSPIRANAIERPPHA